jgi:serine/threonine protein kinase
VTNRDSGSILDGKYEIVERLATGGMGEVYRARHVHLQEHRVIKILRADRATDGHALQRFTQEARIATQIKHPNVAILYDFARLADGSFYMVWEHIPGEDVGNALRSRGPFEVRLAVELGIQALRGLDAIHAAGVIHRDISPDNLMLARDRRGKPLLKIIDLGLAKNLEAPAGFEITLAGTFMGKLMYCSPEQAGSLAEGVPLDHRSDLYSLAAVLYEMVTGKPPFDSESDHGYVLRRLSEPPMPMVGRTPGIAVPASLDEVVLRALERDREKRWPDALAFLHALVRISDQLRQVATQEIPAQRPPGAAPAVAPSVSTRTASRSSSSELSREERLDLLQQIDRAAKRVSEATKLSEQARRAIGESKLAEALETITQLEAISPRHAGLVELKAALAAGHRGETPAAAATASAATPPAAAAPAAPPPAPARPQPAPPTAEQEEHRARVAEAERMLESYIREHKQGLARFALEALLELAPDHPRRADFESWIGLMGEEIAQLKSAEAALDEGRQALARGDYDEARRQLERVERLDPSHRLAEQLRGEIDEADADLRSTAELDRRRDRLETLIGERRLADAEQELARLAAGGLAKVSIEGYRLRMRDLAALADREAQGRDLERRYREQVQHKQWAAARDVVLEFERAIPTSPRPAQLFAEIARYEEIDRKQQGVEQGVRQLETFLAQNKLGEAEMALKILNQMAGDHPRLPQLAERVRALRGD